VFALYREKYFDLNVQHFHEKLQAEHGIELSYTWVKQGPAGSGSGGARTQARGASQAAGAAAVAGDAVAYRRQPPSVVSGRTAGTRPDRDSGPTPRSEIYYAQLVEEESTATVMAGLKEVVERKGVFCALYSDRGSHFWLTPEGGRQGGRPSPHPGGAGVARVGRADDPSLLAASAWAQRAQLRHMAGPLAAGVAACASWGRWRRRTGFCGKNTSPSSIAVFRLRSRQRGECFCALPES